MNMLLAVLTLVSGLFDVQTVPAGRADSQCFIAETDTDGTADLFILSGNTLFIYENAEAGARRTLPLRAGTAALDVADIDGDGFNEVITAGGGEVRSYSLAPGAEAAPRVLFRKKTCFSGYTGMPFLHVMAVMRNETPLLALPGENSFDLCKPDGEIVESFPAGLDAPYHASMGNPFTALTTAPPQAGPPDALEFRVRRTQVVKPNLPSELLPVETPAQLSRLGTPLQARDAAARPPEAWPWFPLRNGDAGRDERVLYAVTGPEPGDSLIRIQRARAERGQDEEAGLTPKRRYPGRLVTAKDNPPDFNADGYADLLLWNPPAPAPTVTGITRAVMRQKWPLRITVHLFDPEKGRFSGKPDARLEFEVPVLWFLDTWTRMPLRLLVLRDFDGDGFCDLGCATDENEYSVWRFTPEGVSHVPDFQRRFPEKLRSIAFVEKLEGRRRTSIALRSEAALFVLKANTPLPFTGVAAPESGSAAGPQDADSR
jgi:hypothetical protein